MLFVVCISVFCVSAQITTEQKLWSSSQQRSIIIQRHATATWSWRDKRFYRDAMISGDSFTFCVYRIVGFTCVICLLSLYVPISWVYACESESVSMTRVSVTCFATCATWCCARKLLEPAVTMLSYFYYVWLFTVWPRRFLYLAEVMTDHVLSYSLSISNV